MSYFQQQTKSKQQQAQQIEYLLLYLEKSMAEAGLTEDMILRAKHQKRELENQIKQLSDDMKSLI